MNELQQELFEKQLVSIAKELEYPRTPNIAGSVMKRMSAFPSRRGTIAPEAKLSGGGVRGEGHPRFISRRLAWSLTILLILFSSLMLIPPARAAIIEFIQIGIVRIFRAEPTPSTPPNEEFPSTIVPVTATPGPTLEALIPILEDLAGEMTLEEARQAVNYSILLPSYPPDLGEPDRIFVQEADGKMTILVWLDPQEPEHIRMSLHFVPPGSWAIDKMNPALVQETTINGQRAVWAVGPYPIRFSNGNLDFIRLIDGHVLIWTDDEMTYRLETDLSLEEAIKVAESLEPK
ncbi:hypothetical protein EHM92_06280 [bacterium]|nr:MAG: hypothetical protein EHM92_06280 [bacterium]